jgi:glycosyltransferase involved in cell wall biosynthesis
VYLRGDAYDPYHLNPSAILWIARYRPDVVVVQGYGDPTNLLAILYCKIKRIPYVLSVDGGEIGSVPRIAQFLIRSIVQGARAFIAGSSSAERVLRFYGAPQERIFRVLVATDLERVHNAAMRLRAASTLGIHNQEETAAKTILFVGRLVPEKGILDLVDAFLRLRQGDRDLRLLVIGRGPLKEKLQQATRKQAPVDVMFVDFLDHEDFATTLTNAGVLVLPSRKEPVGIVSLEAFVAGTPVVLSDACGTVGALPDSPWVTVFPAGDIGALTNSIGRSLKARLRELDPVHIGQIRAFLNDNSFSRQAEEFENATKVALNVRPLAPKHQWRS